MLVTSTSYHQRRLRHSWQTRLLYSVVVKQSIAIRLHGPMIGELGYHFPNPPKLCTGSVSIARSQAPLTSLEDSIVGRQGFPPTVRFALSFLFILLITYDSPFHPRHPCGPVALTLTLTLTQTPARLVMSIDARAHLTRLRSAI